jgi:peptidyl-prolyl cis-trans isomerase A (cyclophilin A)
LLAVARAAPVPVRPACSIRRMDALWYSRRRFSGVCAPRHPRRIEANPMTVIRIARLLPFLACALLALPAAGQTVVCAETTLDTFCMELLQADAPLSTAHFLNQVDAGTYDKSLLHASVRGTATYLAGGRYQAALDTPALAGSSTLTNEFKLPHLRGTVAFDIDAGQPNSATTGWHINVADNQKSFASSTSAGAVFARVLGSGLDVIDRLSRLPVQPLNDTTLARAPMLKLDSKVTADDVVQIVRLYRYAGTVSDYLTYGLDFPPPDPNKAPTLTEVVCIETNLGEFCIKLFPEDAPKTVANFLNYVRDGDYSNSFFHRLVRGFVLQGGGFTFRDGSGLGRVPQDPPVVNEYRIPNARGTVAMAKLGNDPNSATNQFFINLTDNSAVLGPANNSGFTVFGQVVIGLDVVDGMSTVGTYDLSLALSDGALSELPLVNPDATRSADDFIMISRAYVTQREIKEGSQTQPKTPLGNVVALGNYGLQPVSEGVRIPLRINGKLYQVFVIKSEDPDPAIFQIDLIRIVELLDNGRVAANYDGRLMQIPSVRVGTDVYSDVVFELIDVRTLTFRLVSFTKI